MKKLFSKYTLVVTLIFVNSKIAFAAVDPNEIYEKAMGPLQARITTAKNIVKPNDQNMAVITGCFMATQIYLKEMLPAIGERKLISIGLPSSQEANNLLDGIKEIAGKQRSNFRNEDEYMAKIKPINADFRKYLFDDIGNNQIRANNKRVTSWLTACNGMTETYKKN